MEYGSSISNDCCKISSIFGVSGKGDVSMLFVYRKKMVVTSATNAATVSAELNKIAKGIRRYQSSRNSELSERKSRSRLTVNKLTINSAIYVTLYSVDVDFGLLVCYRVSGALGEEQQKTLQYISEKKLDPGRSG